VARAATAPPWRADRAWDPAGEPGVLDRRGRRAALGAIAVAAVLLPWNALAAGRPDLVWPGLVLVVDVLLAALVVRAAWLRAAWRRAGAVRLRLGRFPLFLGERLEAVLVTAAGGDGRGAVEVTLACLERRPLVSGGGTEEVEVWRSSQVLRPAPEVEVVFELPSPGRGLGTDLGPPALRRWELRAEGRSGARVREAFPVPVYAPPPDGKPASG
jgi:hypothetical protein